MQNDKQPNTMMVGGAKMTGLERGDAALTAVEHVFAVLAGLATLAVTIIVVIDVTLRYLVNSPLAWSYDLIGSYLVPLAFFLILSDTFRRNHHIAVDIIYLRLGLKQRQAARFLIAVIPLGVFVPIAWLAAVQAVERFRADEVVAGTILWPTWIPSAIAAAGFALLSARLALDAVALGAAMLRGSEAVPGESPARAAPSEADAGGDGL